MMNATRMQEMKKMFAWRKDEKKNDEVRERKYERKQQILKMFDHQSTHLVLNEVRNISDKGISEVKPQLIHKGVFSKTNKKIKSFI